MIVEHEVLEQIEEEVIGRALTWVCNLIRGLGRDEPMSILKEMWRAGSIALHDDAGQPMPSWVCEEIWRVRDESRAAHVLATDLRSARVHG